MKDRKVLLLVTLALVLGMLASIFLCYQRIKSEGRNNVVEIAVDYSDVERVAASENSDVRAVLSKFAKVGATSVALTEDLVSNTDMNSLIGVDPKRLPLYIKSKGIDPVKVRNILSAGLRVIPRVRNSFAMNGGAILKKINSLYGYDTVIFAEEEVLGYPNHLKDTAGALKTVGLKYGFVEFGKQYGDSDLAALCGTNVVIVHSIAPDEMGNLKRREMLERYVRAVRERNVRFLYVHLLQYPDYRWTLEDTNASFLNDLKQELLARDFDLGKASAPEGVKAGTIGRAMIGLAIGAGTVLAVDCFMPVGFIASLVIIIILGLIPSSKFLALMASLVFPIYAVISQFPAKKSKAPITFSVAINSVITIAAVTTLGGVFIASLLAGPTYMLGTDMFSGVKLAVILPLLAVAGYFFFRDEDGRIRFKSSLKKFFALLDVKVTGLFLFLLALGALAALIMILRSGNFGLPVPGFEKLARSLLDNALFIRPRTKEFLIGYPALVIALIMYLRGENKWLWLVIAVGALAPVSMINSFCHVHTPLLLTIVRSCIGLILGILFGLVYYMIYQACSRMYRSIAQ